jgi:hypothetical protein
MLIKLKPCVALCLLAAGAAADQASLHKTIQGRWRADGKSIAEQTPQWKTMTEKQREVVLSLVPSLEFDISATRIVFLAPTKEDKDETLAYTVLGLEGQKLKLSGRDPTGEEKPFTIEVVDPDTLHLAVPDAPVFKLVRVKATPASPRP